MTQPGNLAHFLVSQKEAFLADLAAGNGKGWVVATGNEAGDLDSITSAVGFAFLNSALDATRTAALVLTPKKLMNLRPENLLALQRANIPIEALLHPEDLPFGTEKLVSEGVKLALVDHNRMLPAFGTDDDAVVAVIDHHEDEGAHMHANPRMVQTPMGSCSSLVTKHFMPQWKASVSGPAGAAGSPVPPELATFLLSSILIDTQGLKKGGKAMADDYTAAEFLYPLSTLVDASTAAVTDQAFHDGTVTPLEAYATELAEVKFNVTGMPTLDLLQRDYKHYAWPTKSAAYPELQVGLSTVPMSLQNQVTAEKSGWESYFAHVDQFMAERGLDIEGVLTSFKSEKKQKSKRELVLIVRTGGAIPDIASAKKILASLTAGLEAETDKFALAPWGEGKNGPKGDLAAAAAKYEVTSTRVAAAYDQGNHHSTRKQVAPAMMDLVSKLA